MSVLSADAIARQYKTQIAKSGASILYRQITRVHDADPSENPCSTSALLMNGAFSSGVSTISLKAATLTGFLRAGDTILLGGITYTITANTAAASSNAIASVAISPSLQASAADGVAATATFVGEVTLKAIISSYPIKLVDGALVQNRDLSIIVAASDLGLTPATEDEVSFNGETRKVVGARPRYAQATVVAWDIQVR